MEKKEIAASFSQAAIHYDRYAFLQQEIGVKLVQKITSQISVRTILDLGTGTGQMCFELKKIFPEAKILGCDLAWGMVQKAQQKRKNEKNLFFQQAEIEKLPYQENSFEIIVSNLAFQWIENLPAAFGEIKRVMKEKGKLFFTTFGANSLKELYSFFESSENFSSQGQLFKKRIVAEMTDLEQILSDLNFEQIRLRKEEKRIFFPETLDFLKWLKNIGSPGFLSSILNLARGKKVVSLINYYQKKFRHNGYIYATFEVIEGEAQKQ
jgi:malonyl-CoA O-methyltransferase